MPCGRCRRSGVRLSVPSPNPAAHRPASRAYSIFRSDMTTAHPTLRSGVGHVLFVGAQSQVCRPNTARLVTGVHDFQPSRDVAKVQHPREAVRAKAMLGTRAHSNLAVAVRGGARPDPAGIGFDDASGEALKKGRPATRRQRSADLRQQATQRRMRRRLAHSPQVIQPAGFTFRKGNCPSIIRLTPFTEQFDRLCWGGSHNPLHPVRRVKFSDQAFDWNVRDP
jgi:hypothetical protein